MKYIKSIVYVIAFYSVFIGNIHAATNTYNDTLDLTNFQYTVDYYGTMVDAAADMVRFDLGTGWDGEMEFLLTTGNFSGFAMLGIALTTDPNDALYNDPSTFLQLATAPDVTQFFNDNVLGWQFYLWGNNYILPNTTNDVTGFFNPMQFDPNEHYYAFVAGGALAGFGSEVDVSLQVSDGTPNPVPIPAAAWLFATGIAGFLGIGRRKKLAA
jgi:hypothetical protein